jgi:hypothetical protein
MNFNLLFGVLTSFSFILKFSVNSERKQDFFLFNGSNASAHLYRENESFYLYLSKDRNFSIYHSKSSFHDVEFSWDGFVLNNEKMQLFKSTGEISDIFFDTFTFVSPIIDSICSDVNDNLQPLYQLKNVNYGYVAIMICVAILIIESKAIGVKVYDHMKRKNMNEYMTVLEVENETNV